MSKLIEKIASDIAKRNTITLQIGSDHLTAVPSGDNKWALTIDSADGSQFYCSETSTHNVKECVDDMLRLAINEKLICY